MGKATKRPYGDITDPEIVAKIDECVAAMVENGTPQDEAIPMCIAKFKSGNESAESAESTESTESDTVLEKRVADKQTRYIRAFVDDASRREMATAEPGTSIQFIASTPDIARDGLIIESSAWQLDHYRANPIGLWCHDYTSVPIARFDVQPDSDALRCKATFDQQDEFARKVEDKYRRGFLNAVSVGWNTLRIEPPARQGDVPRVTKAELLDISFVPVPGDPGALIERQARGLQALHRSLSELNLDESDDELIHDGEFEDVAAAMMRLYLPGLPMSERERRRSYNRLAAKYRRLGKVAPEWFADSELSALSIDELRGLFLEGEPDLFPFYGARAGAVLSARNRADLEEAIKRIQGVLDRAEPKEKAPTDETYEEGERAANAEAEARMLCDVRDTLVKLKL